MHNTSEKMFFRADYSVWGPYLVEQLLRVIIKCFMGEHALIVVDTVPCGVEQLTGEFT